MGSTMPHNNWAELNARRERERQELDEATAAVKQLNAYPPSAFNDPRMPLQCGWVERCRRKGLPERDRVLDRSRPLAERVIVVARTHNPLISLGLAGNDTDVPAPTVAALPNDDAPDARTAGIDAVVFPSERAIILRPWILHDLLARLPSAPGSRALAVIGCHASRHRQTDRKRRNNRSHLFLCAHQ